MKFEFATAGRIVFGPGVFAQTAPLSAALGRKALLVTGRHRARLGTLEASLAAAGVSAVGFTVESEPDTGSISYALERAREEACDLVIAVGGGSVLDTGKAVAALLRQEGELLDYLEVIGRARPLRQSKVPLVAVPTTAGTGAEATGNAVIFSPGHRVKVSLRHPELFPSIALIDPSLTLSLPPEVTAATGMDALTQLIEPFVSSGANPMTDALCRDGLARLSRSLRTVFLDGGDQAARADMSLASLFSGMALANAKLGAVHGIAGSLGGMIKAPHGSLCAALLPGVMEKNIRLLKAGRGAESALQKYLAIARILIGSPSATAEDGAAWVKETSRVLEIKSLAGQGMRKGDSAELVEKALRASSMKGNPVALTSAEVAEIIDRAY